MTKKDDIQVKKPGADGTKSHALTAAEILGQTVSLSFEWVDIPEWGGGVWVRELTGIERDRFEASLVKGRGSKRRVSLVGSRARLVALGAIEGPPLSEVESGKEKPPDPLNANALFTLRDVERLSKLGAKALERVADRVRILSGIIDDDEEEGDHDLGNGLNAGSGSY